MTSEKKIKLVITDSGLGGLSVFFEFGKLLTSGQIADEVELIFFNALYDRKLGYNDMPNEAVKIEMLERVFDSMEKFFQPDFIVIACNTLSVLYKKTNYYIEHKNKLFGIIEPAMNAVIKRLSPNTDRNIIIMGTATTINSDEYQRRLREAGVNDEQIIAQACPKLETAIQNEPEGFETNKLIRKYISEANEKIERKNADNLMLLACTHYGIIEGIFYKAALNAGIKNCDIVNPNYSLVKGIMAKFKPQKSGKLNHRVISRVKLDLDKNSGIIKKLTGISPEAATAVLNYEHIPELF